MSKDLFLLMRQEEIVTDNFLPTKKEIQKTSTEFANKITESGEFNLQEVYAQARRLKESLDVIEKHLKTKLPDENFEAFGLKATYSQGGNTINFKDDDIVKVLEKQLSDRKDLLKVALKSEDVIFDSDGVEVPKVSTTPRKSSLSVTF